MSERKQSRLTRRARAKSCMLVTALVALFAASWSRAIPQKDARTGDAATTAGNSANGKQIFVSQSCSKCHGSEAQGGVGPRIGPPPGTLAEFFKAVRQPAGQMPPFAARTLSDQDITDLYAYLETVAAPAEAVVLTGNAQTGKQLFVSDGCYECHGYVGQGGSASAGVRIGPPPISLAAVIAYIRQPSGGMPRYAKAVVSDQDVADIYAYLKTIPVPVPAKDIPLLTQ